MTRSTGGQNLAPGDSALGQVVASNGGRGRECCSLRITDVVGEQCDGCYSDSAMITARGNPRDGVSSGKLVLVKRWCCKNNVFWEGARCGVQCLRFLE